MYCTDGIETKLEELDKTLEEVYAKIESAISHIDEIDDDEAKYFADMAKRNLLVALELL